MIYLNHSSTSSPKAPAVAEAIGAYLAGAAGVPGRGEHGGGAEAARTIARLRKRLADLVNADAPERMVLTSGATQALNLAILGLLMFGRTPRGAGARPRVVFSALEHNSVTRPLMALEERGLIDTTEVPFDAEGLVDPEAVGRAVDEQTVLVAVQRASNVLGSIQATAEIRRRINAAAQTPPLLLVDAAQAAGVVPIDVRAEGIDLLAFSGHKGLLGPTGTGALYVSPRAFPGAGGFELAPALQGGTGVDSDQRRMPAQMPSRFEAGTPNVLGQVGFLAALEDPSRPGVERTIAHERTLADRFIDAWRDEPRLSIFGPRDRLRRAVGTGVVSFTVRGMSPADVEGVLGSSFGIAVRAGLHCAPGAHRLMGTLASGGTVRISPGPFSTDADIDALNDALRDVVATV